MRSKTTLITGLLLFSVGFICRAQKLPGKKKILQAMVLTNDYFMKKWPDPGEPIKQPERTYTSNLWTRAVYYEGLMALYNIQPKKEYLDYALQWGQKNNWHLRKGVVTTRNADNHACGQTYIDLFMMDKDPVKISVIRASIDSMMRTSKINDWDWIDAIQMAMPVFARLGYVFNDSNYYYRMFDMYIDSRNTQKLYNTKDRLWWRDKDFLPPYTEPNGGNCYWSRGNGWVLAALARTMDFLPQSSPYYAVFLSDLKSMCEALIPLQRKDGFWNVSLHDSTHFGGRELTGTALFTYGMAWGINKGYLDKGTYLPVVTKAWNAMERHAVHKDGMLGYVQGTGKEPKDGQPVTYDKVPNFEDYGLGCFLLAGFEMYKLQGN